MSSLQYIHSYCMSCRERNISRDASVISQTWPSNFWCNAEIAFPRTVLTINHILVQWGESPLMMASHRGLPSLVGLYLEAGADVHVENDVREHYIRFPVSVL